MSLMTQDTPLPWLDYLNASHEFKQIVVHSRKLAAIEVIFKQIIPAEISGHVQVNNLKDNCLIIVVNNAHWANKLRFEQNEMLSKLRQNGFPELGSIKVKVNPSSPSD